MKLESNLWIKIFFGSLIRF